METFDPTPDGATSAAATAEQTLPTPPRAPAVPVRRRHVEPVRLALELDLSPAACPPGYAPRTIDVRLASVPQRVALRLLTTSLIAQRAELCDRTPVTRPEQALEWLLDQIAIRLPSNVLDELMDAAG